MEFLRIAQIIIGILLIASVLLQAKGGELGATFGGGGEIYQTKRGIEKFLFFATIILAFIFFAIAFIQMLR